MTAALLNEVLERRQRERWSVLAQYALFEFVRTARLVWSGLLELAGLVPDVELGHEALTAGSEAVRDTARLTEAMDRMLADVDRRIEVHRLIAELLTRGQEIAVEVNEKDAVHVELKPGQASLHHVLLFHGSEPNQSYQRRIGLAIRYIPTHLKQAVGQRDWATLVRGKDSYHHVEPAHVPRRDLEPEALQFHKMVSEEQVRVLYRGTGKTAYRA